MIITVNLTVSILKKIFLRSLKIVFKWIVVNNFTYKIFNDSLNDKNIPRAKLATNLRERKVAIT